MNRVIVGGILVHDNKVLMIQEAKISCRGMWNLPMGKLENCEYLEDGAKREFFEETGLHVEIDGLVHIGNKIYNGENLITIVYSMKSDKYDCHYHDENTLDTNWFTLDEIHNMKDNIRSYELLIKSIERKFDNKITDLSLITTLKQEEQKDYFKDDEYWKYHLNQKLEDDIWIEKYKEYFLNKGKCLDLGCGIGQFSKILMDYNNEVISADISDIALSKVKEFNNNIVKLDMRENLPFENNSFDLVFANLSIHYFSDNDTKKLMQEIKRILKNNGLFIGSVNGLQGIEKIKDTAKEIEKNFYFNKNKYVRLFDRADLKKYLNIFNIIKIEEKETIRYEKKKNYLIFIVSK